MELRYKPKLRTAILIVVIVGLTLVTSRVIMSMKAPPPNGGNALALKGVTTTDVELGNNTAIVNFGGKLKAVERIEVFSEVPGVMLNGNFREGTSFKKGSSIIRIESSEARNSLKAQKSGLLNQVSLLMGDIGIDYPDERKGWEEFLNKLDVSKKLPQLPEVKDEKLRRYLSGKNVLSTYYNIQSAERRLSKYTIAAPFAGVVTQSLIKKGTLVRAGQKLGEFVKPGVYELETEVSLSDLDFIKLKDKVVLQSDELSGSWNGEIYRINEKVDESSQLIKVIVRVKSDELKEGIYLQGMAQGAGFDSSFVADRTLITDNSLFLFQDSAVIERKVDVLYLGADKAIVSGLKQGDKVITTSPKGLFPGQKVRESDKKK